MVPPPLPQSFVSVLYITCHVLSELLKPGLNLLESTLEMFFCVSIAVMLFLFVFFWLVYLQHTTAAHFPKIKSNI